MRWKLLTDVFMLLVPMLLTATLVLFLIPSLVRGLDAPPVVVGRDCQMSWDIPVWPDGSAVVDLMGYRVYIRQMSGAYNFAKPSVRIKADDALQTTCRKAGIHIDGGYAVVITAVNRSGAESIASEEKTFVRDTRTPPSPPGLTVLDRNPDE